MVGGGWGWGLPPADLVCKAPVQIGPVAFIPGLGLPNAGAQRASGAAGRFGAWARDLAHHSNSLVFSADLVLRTGGWIVPFFFFFLKKGIKVSRTGPPDEK